MREQGVQAQKRRETEEDAEREGGRGAFGRVLDVEQRVQPAAHERASEMNHRKWLYPRRHRPIRRRPAAQTTRPIGRARPDARQPALAVARAAAQAAAQSGPSREQQLVVVAAGDRRVRRRRRRAARTNPAPPGSIGSAPHRSSRPTPLASASWWTPRPGRRSGPCRPSPRDCGRAARRVASGLGVQVTLHTCTGLDGGGWPAIAVRGQASREHLPAAPPPAADRAADVEVVAGPRAAARQHLAPFRPCR